ncbi:MAG: sigma-70 family RNA polymerase sigma factor [Acidimicrobiia bacterium]|nr:sigma-70 family RNA polymerase sigma factor [Acidimicrobiia bacterium]MBV9040869.1 sigma-70 family RNA polymerase sigma factor [Acidimicrobiia bacterium]
MDGRTGGREFDASFPDLFRHAYRVAYRLVGPQEANDLAQEALARAYGHWGKVGALDEPAAWVSRVTTNLAFDFWRRRRVRRYAGQAAASIPPVDADRLDLYSALADLPQRQRQVVAMRFLADQSEAATAAALGCSLGTVKSHAARGLAALRAHLPVPSED